MKDKLLKLASILHPKRLSETAQYLLKDEAISGKLIILAVLLALIAANSPLNHLYESLWSTKLDIGLGNWSINLDLRHWVSDGLMALFFLVVGLELKREIVSGELGKFRTALLPFAAAVGGMVVPAIIYLTINAGSETSDGWAIPTATDIALAIGLLALLGKRIPSSIRLFLLTLAIVDDILAVIIIAIFYSTGLDFAMLLLSLGIVLLLATLTKMKRLSLFLFIVAGVGLWLTLNASGVHASISGAILGLLAPTVVMKSGKKAISARLEHAIIPISTLIVIPLFAFANTGIHFSNTIFQSDSFIRLSAGIFFGLVIGKVVGIVSGTWLTIRLGLSSLPEEANWNHIIGIGLLAGIGFTVSIFVTELAFQSEELINISFISIFIASIVSGCLGLITLRFFNRAP